MTRRQPGQGARRPLILLTNDDGVLFEGIKKLRRALAPLAEVWVVAPDREKSACSLSLTLHRPLRVYRAGPRVFAVDGTTADCVYLAANRILPRRPDLLLSGINNGPNLARQDIAHSGTVAAALQARHLGINSAAVSAVPDESGRFDFAGTARLVVPLAAQLLGRKADPPLTLNVNVPFPPVRGVLVTVLGEKHYDPEIVEKKDPRGNSYFWIGTGSPEVSGPPESDVAAVARGFISLTPLDTDLTDKRAVPGRELRRLAARLSSAAARPRRVPGKAK